MLHELDAKTQAATPTRRRKARAEGRVARSTDLAAAGGLLIVVVMVSVLGPWFLVEARALLVAGLDPASTGAPGAGDLPSLLAAMASGAVRLALPIMLVAWSATLLACLSQVGGLLAPGLVRPRVSHLGLSAGLQRILGERGWSRAVLDLGKIAGVIGVAWLTVRARAVDLLSLPGQPLTEALANAGGLVQSVTLRAAAVLLVLGLVDYALHRWRLERELRMTWQEIRDEVREAEGDPRHRGHRRRVARHQSAMAATGWGDS